MIRSSLTLSICSHDAQESSYLVNGTHLGLLTPHSQSTHVQTSSRQVQLIVALRDQDDAAGATLVRQKQQIKAWQEFLKIISRNETRDLNLLMQKYRLFPDWLVCYDEKKLQAWLPEAAGFYLLRNLELHRLEPVPPRVQPDMAGISSAEPCVYYQVLLRQYDQFFILPPDLLSLFSSQEVTDLLLGLRQQPAKVGELIRLARLRGYSRDFTWLGIQINLLQAESQPDTDGRGVRTFASFLAGLFGGRFRDRSEEEPDSHSTSLESQSGAGKGTSMAGRGVMTRLANSRRLPVALSGAILLLAVIVALIVLFFRPPTAPPVSTTPAPETTSTRAPSPTPTPTARPTQPPEPTPTPGLVVSVRQLNLRSQPTRNSELILTLARGDLLYQLQDENEGWAQVRTLSGREGYVFFDYVSSIND
ncbi:MAG: SH3 domain-containing protein [Saccharofermentanales bacterium]